VINDEPFSVDEKLIQFLRSGWQITLGYSQNERKIYCEIIHLLHDVKIQKIYTDNPLEALTKAFTQVYKLDKEIQ